MYSLTYGTVPIVRETGGLADTVIKFNEKTEEGNGFVFKKYDSDEMLKEIKRAVKTFEDKNCLLYTSPSPRDRTRSRMPSSA